MTPKKRTILFFAFVLLFLVAAPSLALYSLGYRFDWSELAVTKTGAVFVKTDMPGVSIFINNKLAGRTNLLFDYVLKENLLPRTYRIEAKRSGYHSWGKELGVSASYTTSAKSVTLFPENPGKILLASEVAGFFPAEGMATALILQEEGGAQSAHIRNMKNGSQIPLPLDSPAEEGVWSPNGKFLVVRSGGTLIAFTPFSSGSPCFAGCKVPVPRSPLAFFLPSADGKTVFAVAGSSRSLWRIPFPEAKSEPLGLDGVAALVQYGGSLVALAQSGALFSVFQDPEAPPVRIGEFTIPSTGENVRLLAASSSVFFLSTDEGAQMIDTGAKTVSEISLPASRIVLNSEGVAAFSTSREIGLLYLQDRTDEPAHAKGEEVFLTRFSDRVDDLQWMKNGYLIVRAGKKVFAVETDDRDSLNLTLLLNEEVDRLSWNPEKGTAVFLSGKNLFETEPLIP